MLSFKGTWTGQALEMDGGHASGGTPKGGCGGHGRAAAVEGSFLLGAMHGIQWQTQKKMGQIPVSKIKLHECSEISERGKVSRHLSLCTFQPPFSCIF